MTDALSQEKNNKISLEQRNFIWFSEKIDEIKKPISTALWWVLEYQRNNDNYISIKLFNSKNQNISKQDIDNAHMFIEHYNNKLKRIKEELIEEPNIYEPQKKLLINIIEWTLLRSKLLYYATYIEAEKWWYILDQNDKQNYLKNIEKIEKIIYGWSISDNKKEKEAIINNLSWIFNKNSSFLDKNQKNIFSSFLSKFSNSKTTTIKKNNNKTESEKISIINVCYLFQKVLDTYDVKNKIVIIDENLQEEKEENNILYIPKNYDQKERTNTIKKYKLEKTVKIILDDNLPNFGVGDYKLDVPGKYKDISIERICQLIDHEISTHLLRMINKNKGINIKTEWYLETEEWIATMNEKLVSQNRENLKSDEPTIHHTSTFIAENYNFNDTKELLYIYYILNWKSTQEAENLSEQRALRVKRYHSFDLPGANRKDVVYRRWLIDAIKYIKDLDKTKEEDIKQLTEDIWNFYIAKLGKDEIRNANKIFEWLSIDKEQLIMPIAIGKILYEKLLWNKMDKIDDIRFLATTQKLNYKQKKIILETLSFIKEKTEKES